MAIRFEPGAEKYLEEIIDEFDDLIDIASEYRKFDHEILYDLVKYLWEYLKETKDYLQNIVDDYLRRGGYTKENNFDRFINDVEKYHDDIVRKNNLHIEVSYEEIDTAIKYHQAEEKEAAVVRSLLKEVRIGLNWIEAGLSSFVKDLKRKELPRFNFD